MAEELQVDVAKMLHVLSVIDLVPNIAGFPSSTFVRLSTEGKKLSLSLAAELCGTVSVKASGDLSLKRPIFCDRNLLFPFLSVSTKSEKPFVFSFSKDRLLVTHGRRKGLFDCAVSGMGYHDAEHLDGGIALEVADGMLERIQMAASSATMDNTVPELNCVFIQRIDGGAEFYGSNQLLAVCTQHKMKSKLPESLALPLLIVPNLKADGLDHIALHKNEVSLHFDCGMLWQPISIKAQKGFPRQAIDDLIEDLKKLPVSFSVKARWLGTITERFGQYLASSKKQDWVMHVKGAAGEKELSLQVKIAQGVFKEKITIEGILKNDFEAEWSLDILLPVLEHFYKMKDVVLQVRAGAKTPFLFSAAHCDVVLQRKDK